MVLRHPVEYEPVFQDKTLNFFAYHILEMYQQTLEDTYRPEDDNYTFWTKFFGRVKNRIIYLLDTQQVPNNISLVDRSNKCIVCFGQTECRFFNDSILSPRKKGAFVRTEEFEQLDLFSKQGYKAYFNFVLQEPLIDEEQPRVALVGYDYYNHQPVALWEHDVSKKPLSVKSDDFITPKSTEFNAFKPKFHDDNQSDNASNES